MTANRTRRNITSFKIEGRMKSPEYVGFITRLYRNLLDQKEINLEEELDKLKTIFNREFTEGNLFQTTSLMNTNSPNHIGLEIGKVVDISKKKIKIKLSKPLNQANSKDFEKTSNSVVSIHTYTGNKKTKQGSGFIYKVEKDKAYILTNNHVVDEKANLKVFVTEEKSVKATLVGRDKYLDIAVLTIENNNYKALKLNRKNNYNIGDTVYTIGTPLNNEFFNSVSSGIISKTNRLRYEKNDNEDILMDLIQTDIIINPGNSGCPLFNSKLEVIGIYTSIIETENISAISFAVPITQVINKLDDLEKKGTATDHEISASCSKCS